MTNELRPSSGIDAMLRRKAKASGLELRRSRWRLDTIDNFGGYMLVDPWTNCLVDGERFNLGTADVLSRLNA